MNSNGLHSFFFQMTNSKCYRMCIILVVIFSPHRCSRRRRGALLAFLLKPILGSSIPLEFLIQLVMPAPEFLHTASRDGYSYKLYGSK